MRNSLITLKALCHILPAFILSCFLSCKEDHAQNLRSRTSFPEIKEVRVNQGQIFLTFLDSLVKLFDTAFNEAGVKSVNKKYVNQLPLVMYDLIREENRQDIIMQYYKNNETSSEVESGIVILIPPKNYRFFGNCRFYTLFWGSYR